MVYYFSLAGDQERINCLRPKDEIADLPNWFACGEFDNMETAAIDEGYSDKYHHAQGNYFPLPLYGPDGCANYKLADGTPALRTEAEKAAEIAARPAPEPTQLDRVEAQITYTAMMTDTMLEV